MKWFSSSENSEISFMNEVSNDFQLSFQKRIFLFITFLGTGIVFCFMSTWMILSPRKFAKYYTIGIVFIIISTFFLVGPKKQFSHMFHSSRIFSASIYFGSIIITLYCALSLQITSITFIMIIIQFGAAIWYGASYIPFGQDCLRSTAKTILPI